MIAKANDPISRAYATKPPQTPPTTGFGAGGLAPRGKPGCGCLGWGGASGPGETGPRAREMGGAGRWAGRGLGAGGCPPARGRRRCAADAPPRCRGRAVPVQTASGSGGRPAPPLALERVPPRGAPTSVCARQPRRYREPGRGDPGARQARSVGGERASGRGSAGRGPLDPRPVCGAAGRLRAPLSPDAVRRPKARPPGPPHAPRGRGPQPRCPSSRPPAAEGSSPAAPEARLTRGRAHEAQDTHAYQFDQGRHKATG